MARKHQPEAPATPVRWTDEEWHAIAHRILSSAGINDPAALDVGEIKAKDVYVAQDVLPEERRRKLISIQQGFDASRKRLRAHLDTLSPGATNGTADDAHMEQPAAAHGTTSGMKEAAEATPASETAAVPDAAPQHAAAQAEAANEEQAPVATPAEPQIELLSAQQRAAVAPGLAETAASSRTDGTKPDRKKTERSQVPGESMLHQPDFIEMARPFVAMVCEELANALLKAFGDSVSAGALKAAVNPANVAAAGRKQGDNRQRDTARVERSAPAPAPAAAAPDHGQAGNALELDEDHEQAENEVQPLFDPKLPPDPNSPFRPRIALVASRPHDLVELQQRFPQFELIAVTLDELRSNPVLRTCQRIVGLREDVPVMADEYLRRTFGSRYFRANGGVAKVREQLQSWLSNPAVGNADPFRPPKQGNGKGAGGARKRQFRRPRP